MAEYVPHTETKSASLESDENLEIEFRPENAGPVSTTVRASWDRLIPPDPTKRRLELFAPGRDGPVAVNESRGITPGSRLDFDVSEEDLATAGQWRSRVANVERMEGTEEFELAVSYPSDTEVLTVGVDAFDIEQRLHELFGSATIGLTSGPEESVVRLRPEIGVEDYRFTAPDFDEEISVGDTHHTVRERLYELTAQTARVTLLEEGSVQFTFGFDEANYDLVGDPHVRIHRPQVRVTLPLGTTEDAVVTGRPTAVFDFEPGFQQGLSAHVRWAIEDYAEELRSQVGDDVAAAFGRERVHEYVDDVLSREVDAALPDDASLYGVGRVVQGNLEVKYTT